MKLPTCQELIDFLSDYLADELPPERREVFDEHLRRCPDCVNYLANFHATVNSVNSLSADMNLELIPEDLVQAILKSRGASG